ncbi:DNA polymerase III subunit delta' [Actinotignum timonense]|uniref:DNA polymerase III subunit delta' n=1 Tax=Actinotignum TaxID=1653174 RepID=UPI002549C75E|nr:DNA polymerase III subunit delta' [Actinotignum timonense]MDK6590652.1 DNA polymerase III subunit delta' [Actinotignum timonense]MDK6629523.1 DNA polymerase III subunit delta' [Actinotignum timonense]MDK6906883.1 DNA polymerase III subunit delta' [Actinotignum timonense]MDK8782570.1 DNA polymerase III subunit delta' [Actinotignum timonense]MDY5156263.1 DNA polymerase III subunit delta' [Actinotignum timonense]
MSVFDALIGQQPVAELLQRAAWASRIGDPELPSPAAVTADMNTGGATGPNAAASVETAPDSSTTTDISSAAMAQAWLVTGPPGSGRSVAALAFAAAVQCTGAVPGCGHCHACTTTLGGTHPDVIRMDPRSVTISVEETRSLVASSYTFPSVGRRRIIIIEDADRMLERTTNVLLKAIEEPPRDTVWILITASPEDMLPTIRSRCRHVALQVPSVEAVAQLLAGEFDVDERTARATARIAQCHIGRARALLRDPQVAAERAALLRETLDVSGTADAVLAAQHLLDHYPASAGAASTSARSGAASKKGAKAAADTETDTELAEFRASIGLGERESGSASQRAQIRAFEEQRKKRAVREDRDYLDRAMLDVLALYRDVLAVQVDAGVELINADFETQIIAAAAASTPELSVARMDAVAQARRRLAANVAPQLALEAMFIDLASPAPAPASAR